MGIIKKILGINKLEYEIKNLAKRCEDLEARAVKFELDFIEIIRNDINKFNDRQWILETKTAQYEKDIARIVHNLELLGHNKK